jgi:hypothetical protein
MNKLYALVICLMAGMPVIAQKVAVKNSRETLKGEGTDGYSTELEGKKEDVQSSWTKFLKDIGKVRQGDPVTVSEPVFNALTFSKGVLYARVQEKGDKTTVWLGIKPDEWDSGDVNRINHELEKAVYRFGVKFYRDKIQVQIDEAQEAADAVEKQKQRALNQQKDLGNKLVANEQEKIQLEKSIENNKFENAVLLVKIKNNKKAQDSLAHAAEQIQKIKAQHQERQQKVN